MPNTICYKTGSYHRRKLSAFRLSRGGTPVARKAFAMSVEKAAEPILRQIDSQNPYQVNRLAHSPKRPISLVWFKNLFLQKDLNKRSFPGFK